MKNLLLNIIFLLLNKHSQLNTLLERQSVGNSQMSYPQLQSFNQPIG